MRFPVGLFTSFAASIGFTALLAQFCPPVVTVPLSILGSLVFGFLGARWDWGPL